MAIARDKKPDWAAVRAEYIGGGISQRALAQKYGLSETTLMKKAAAEHWNDQREAAYSKAALKAQQKTAEAAANNAATAQRIRAKLLAVLEREIDSLPDSIGTEMHKDTSSMTYEVDKDGKPIKNGRLTKRTDGGKRYRLVDLTKAYRDLVDDDSLDIDTEQVKVIIDV